MTKTIDDLTEEEREALRIMREIVAEKGADYVYPDTRNCRYLDYDEEGNHTGPSCIVGHYLIRVGVPAPKLRSREGLSALSTVPLAGVDEESGLSTAFLQAQREQDRGHTWGEALAVFEEALGL